MAEVPARLSVEQPVTPAMVDAGQQAIADAERELGGRPIRQYPESWRRTLALAVLQATTSQVVTAERERIAAAIEQSVCEPGEHCTDRFCPDCIRWQQARADATVARKGMWP